MYWHVFAVHYGNFLFKYRNGVFLAVLAALLLGFKPSAPFGDRFDGVLDLLGLAVATLGQVVRAAVIGFAYIKRGGVNKQVYADKLVTEGIFAHSRNPLYLGNLLILAGLFIIHNNSWVYLLGGLFFLSAYGAIVAAEEAYLTARFGQHYEEYCRRVPRWWPDCRGLSTTMRAMKFNWKRVVAKDYASAYYWISSAIVLLAYESVYFKGFGATTPKLEVLSMILILVTALFLVARYLKKQRRLT